MNVEDVIEIWNTQKTKADGKNHTENTVLYVLSQAMNEWKQYKEIGTIEEFKKLKQEAIK